MRQPTYLLLLLLAVAAVAVAVPIAQGTTAAKDPRVPGLIRTVNTLKGQVASLQSDVDDLRQTATTLTEGLSSLQKCVKYQVAPITRYGNNTTGYFYGDANQFTGEFFVTSALDFTQAGDTASAYVAKVNPTCVNSARGAGASLSYKTR
jgi:hypothetical protein